MITGPRRSFLSTEPSSMPGLRAWYRELYTASGGAVSQWTDKSGNGFHATQSTALHKPVVSSSVGVANGREILTFNAANYSFLNQVAKSSVISASAFTIYAVLRRGAHPNVNHGHMYDACNLLIDCATAAYTDTKFGIGANGGPTGNMGCGWDPSTIAGSGSCMAYTVNGSVPEGAWKRVCFSYDGTNVYSRVAGSAAASFPRANVNDLAKIFKIGGWYLSPGLSNTDSCYQGDVAEMIFYNQYHAPTAQDFVFGYQQIYFGI